MEITSDSHHVDGSDLQGKDAWKKAPKNLPQMVKNDDLPWKQVKNHLKQI